jgi:rSAM/selenodomain-associated transferase 1
MERVPTAMSGAARTERAATCAIVVMAKASIPGRVKTRLVPPLSPEQAASLNTAFLRDAADNLVLAQRLADVTGCMAYAPKGSEEFFRDTVPGCVLIETVAPDLGACLLHAAATLFDAGYGSVCLLNSDSPTLPVGYLVAAATALASDGERIVLGPSTDGGYYLLGMKKAHHGLFRAIEWSSERVLRQTLQRAQELELPVVTLPSWYDVDDPDGLRVLVGELLQDRPFRAVGRDATPARFTRRCLRTLNETAGLAGKLGRN